MKYKIETILGCTDTAVMPALRPKQVIQAVKMVCALLGKIETIEITEMCDKLIAQCLEFDQVFLIKGSPNPEKYTGRDFILNMGQSRPLFVYFRSFLIPITISIIQIEKSIDGVLGIRTRGRMMVGEDETTELWRRDFITY